MRSFGLYLKESLLLEFKEWHQFVKQNGAGILKIMGHGEKYATLAGEAGHGSPQHMTDYIKTHLGIADASQEHGNWILKKLHAGKISNLEDIPTSILRNLRKYSDLKTRGVTQVELKNINTPDELYTLVSKHDTSTMDEKLGLKEGKDYTLLGENEHWYVYRPHNEAAACGLGKNTNWCTTYGRFDYYHQKGPLTIFIPKKPAYENEKYQHHLESQQFMDFTDKPIHTVRPGPMFVSRPLPNLDEETMKRIEDGLVEDAFSDPNISEESLLKYIEHPVALRDPVRHYGSAISSKSEVVGREIIKRLKEAEETSNTQKSPRKSNLLMSKRDNRKKILKKGLLSEHDSVALPALALLKKIALPQGITHHSFTRSDDGSYNDLPEIMLTSKNRKIAEIAMSELSNSDHAFRDYGVPSNVLPNIKFEDLAHKFFDQIDSLGGTSNTKKYGMNSEFESIAKRSLEAFKSNKINQHVYNIPGQPPAVSPPESISDFFDSPHKSVALDAADFAISHINDHNYRLPLWSLFGRASQSNHAAVFKKFVNFVAMNDSGESEYSSQFIPNVVFTKHKDVARKFFEQPSIHKHYALEPEKLPELIPGIEEGWFNQTKEAIAKDFIEKHLEKMQQMQTKSQNFDIYVQNFKFDILTKAHKNSKLPFVLLNSKHFNIDSLNEHYPHSRFTYLFAPPSYTDNEDNIEYGENDFNDRHIALLNSRHMKPELLKYAFAGGNDTIKKAVINSKLMNQKLFDETVDHVLNVNLAENYVRRPENLDVLIDSPFFNDKHISSIINDHIYDVKFGSGLYRPLIKGLSKSEKFTSDNMHELFLEKHLRPETLDDNRLSRAKIIVKAAHNYGNYPSRQHVREVLFSELTGFTDEEKKFVLQDYYKNGTRQTYENAYHSAAHTYTRFDYDLMREQANAINSKHFKPEHAGLALRSPFYDVKAHFIRSSHFRPEHMEELAKIETSRSHNDENIFNLATNSPYYLFVKALRTSPHFKDEHYELFKKSPNQKLSQALDAIKNTSNEDL